MNAIFFLLLLGGGFCAAMMSLRDWRERLIPDVYLFPFLLIGLAVVQFFPWFFDMREAVMASAFGYVLAFIMGLAFRKKLTGRWMLSAGNSSREAIGLGDVKLLAAGGVWLGFTGLSIALIAACAIGGIWGLRKKQKFIPFAPFFFAGAAAAIGALIILI
jgi:leader peptidase (prepilin peptidase)/N-methyltransferase